jgi:hypothetical protein
VGIRVVVRREVQVLPGAEGAAAVEVQQEGEGSAGCGVVGRVQVELPAGGLIDDRLMAHGDLFAAPASAARRAAARLLEHDSKILDSNWLRGEASRRTCPARDRYSVPAAATPTAPPIW